jgi:hypothetical protein
MRAERAICPMCLMEFAESGLNASCPGCKAGNTPVPLIPLMEYLAKVDFAVVEEFWRKLPADKAQLRSRVLPRIQLLRDRQKREFGSVTILN